MATEQYWIVRVTLDVYECCFQQRRIGANVQTGVRLGKLRDGDLGIFYISTAELHGSQTLSEFRCPFVIQGNMDNIPIEVPSLPQEKRIIYSSCIEPKGVKGACKVYDIRNELEFIKKKDHWGSYLMLPFIRISARDYKTIVQALGG
jgi:hypothetical protein